jgi:hypothetical protein
MPVFQNSLFFCSLYFILLILGDNYFFRPVSRNTCRVVLRRNTPLQSQHSVAQMRCNRNTLGGKMRQNDGGLKKGHRINIHRNPVIEEFLNYKVLNGKRGEQATVRCLLPWSDKCPWRLRW